MPVQHTRFTRFGSTALVAFCALTTGVASAQSTAHKAEYRVQIDSVVVGTATEVVNLPASHVEHAVEHAATPEHADSAHAAREAAAEHQASVLVRTSDPALLAVLRAWMGANNSGSKDTVRPKLVEIDEAGGPAGVVRYVLHDAWPSRIEAGAATIVYQRAEVLH